MQELGKIAALNALSGKPAARVPYMLLTWGFEYMWKCAGIPPWRLARGSFGTWLDTYLATYERHKPDLIVYDSFGSGSEDPILVDETFSSWIIRDGEGEEWEFIKSSFTLVHRPNPDRSYGPAPCWDSREDIDNSIHACGFPSSRLEGLSAVIGAIGENALVLPTCVTGYISACYALGFDRAMHMMLDDEDLFLHLADRISMNDDLHMSEYAQAGAEAVLIADSWASCDILSPSMLRKFALPYQKRIVDAAKRAGLKAILWNLGDVGPILADEAAIDTDAFAFEQPRKGFAVTRLAGQGGIRAGQMSARESRFGVSAAAKRSTGDQGRRAPPDTRVGARSAIHTLIRKPDPQQHARVRRGRGRRGGEGV